MLKKTKLHWLRRTHQDLRPVLHWEVAKQNPAHRAPIANMVNLLCGNVPALLIETVRQLNNTGCLLPYNNLDDYNLFDTMIGGNHAVIKKNKHILDIYILSLLYIVANEISTIFNTVKVLFNKL